jgi:uncharacterized membrane protein YraQ (UPF0718 family)
MSWREQYRSFLWILLAFLVAYALPLGTARVDGAILSGLELLQWYAREHVLLCLVPAFFIAGMIAVFVSQAAVIKYFGAAAPKWLSYTVASVSGSILAVCSCTVLPLFSGIYKRGAGLGPAIAFLYSGPAINIMAIILTARILGLELGIARIVGAVAFSVIIGLLMHLIFGREESARARTELALPAPEAGHRLSRTVLQMFALVGILVFATWAGGGRGIMATVFEWKWWIVALFALLLAFFLVREMKIVWWHIVLGALPVIAGALVWPGEPLVPFVLGIASLSVLLALAPGEGAQWLESSWGFARQILPLLAAGVLIAGFLLGTPAGGVGIIPPRWIADLVGGNSLLANFFASLVGAFMYFATLTEVPIIQGLLGSGMGKGPALALLLAGPALSLPNMLVIRGVIGTQKTVVYVALVVVMATISGYLYASLFP